MIKYSSFSVFLCRVLGDDFCELDGDLSDDFLGVEGLLSDDF